MRNAVALTLALATAGCATVFDSGKQSVSLPPAADTALRVVILDAAGSVVAEGKPPFDVELARARRYRLVAASASGEADTIRVARVFNAVTLLNVFVAPGFLVDIGTGAYLKQDVPANAYRTRSQSDVQLQDEGGEEIRRRTVLQLDSPSGWVAVWASSDRHVEIVASNRAQSDVCMMSPEDAIAWSEALKRIADRSVQVAAGVVSSIDLPRAPGACDITGSRLTAQETTYKLQVRTPLTLFAVGVTMSASDFARFISALRDASGMARNPASFGSPMTPP